MKLTPDLVILFFNISNSPNNHKTLLIIVGRQVMNFYLCSGVDPSKDSVFPPKVTTPVVGTMILSVLLQTAVQIKIFLSKEKINVEQMVPEQISCTSNLKLHFYAKFLNNSLSDFATNIFGVCIAVASVFLVLIINKFSPAELNMYPNYYFVDVLQLYAPMVFGGFLSIWHYSRNKQMRIWIKNEVRENLPFTVGVR